MPELLPRSTNAASVTVSYLLLYIFAALYYWVHLFRGLAGQNRLERRLERYAV